MSYWQSASLAVYDVTGITDTSLTLPVSPGTSSGPRRPSLSAQTLAKCNSVALNRIRINLRLFWLVVNMFVNVKQLFLLDLKAFSDNELNYLHNWVSTNQWWIKLKKNNCINNYILQHKISSLVVSPVNPRHTSRRGRRLTRGSQQCTGLLATGEQTDGR